MLFESAGRNIHDGLRLVNRAMADHHVDEPPNKRAKMIRDPFQGPSDTGGQYFCYFTSFLRCSKPCCQYYDTVIFDILPSLLLAPCKFCVVLLFLELRGSNRTLKYCRIWGYLLHFEYFCCTTKNYKTIHFTTWSLPNITFFTHLYKFCNTLFVKLYQGTTVKLENVNFS